MSVNRYDVVDLIIQTLAEHEKRLDQIGDRLEEIVSQLAKELNISNYMRGK